MLNFTNNQESANCNHNKRSSDWQTLKRITIPNICEDSEQGSSNTVVSYYNFENNLVILGERDIYPMVIHSIPGDLASRNCRLYTRRYPQGRSYCIVCVIEINKCSSTGTYHGIQLSSKIIV